MAATLLAILLPSRARGADASPVARQPENAASLLLITVDTLRRDALGWIGGKNDTPHIDALAAAGFAFPDAVSPVPLTLPSHASILSGRIPRRHGVRDNGQVLGQGPALLAERLAAKGYATAAFVSGYPLRRPFGLDRGFATYDDTLPVGEQGWLERPASDTAAAALAWLRTVPADAPWFLWIHFYDPHEPYDPPRAFWRPGPRGAYDGEVARVDDAIGTLKAGIAARKPSRLLTVFTADHGESLGEHGEHGHGLFIYDSTTLVPMIFHFPGVVAPGESRAPARLVDLAPTALELLGAPALPDVDGISLASLFAARTLEIPPAYVESLQSWIGYGWAPLAALRTSAWKLISAPRPELYDLARDPGELTNVVNEERRTARDLERRLREVEALPVAASGATNDPEVLASLRALGYVGGTVPSAEPPPGLPDPKDRLQVSVRLSEGERLLRARRYREARDLFEAVIAEDPGNRFAVLRNGIAALDSGDYGAAIQNLQKSIALDPEQPEARYALADALTRAGRLAEAREQWLETIRRQPRRAAAWSNLGTVLLQLRDVEGGTEAFAKAHELEPFNRDIARNLAMSRVYLARDALRRGGRDTARTLLRAAIEVFPEIESTVRGWPDLAPLLPPKP